MEEPQMHDRTVSLTQVGAVALWVLAVVLVLAQPLLGWPVGQIGLVTSAGAATVTIRGYFIDLAERERNAFEIGRDASRARSRL